MEDTIDDATEETIDDATEETIYDVTKDTIDDATEDTIDDATEETIYDAPEETIDDATEDTIDDATEESIYDATEETIDDATEDTIEDTTEYIIHNTTFTHHFFDHYLIKDDLKIHNDNDQKIYKAINDLGFKQQLINMIDNTKNLVFINFNHLVNLSKINIFENNYFISSGWNGSDQKPGHAISCYIEYNNEETVNVIFSNSGYGVFNHNSQYNVILYKMELEKIPKLIKLLNFLDSLVYFYGKFKNKLDFERSFMKSDFEDDTKIFYYDIIINGYLYINYADIYYNSIEKLLGPITSQIPLLEGYKQLSGSCAFWGPYSLFQYLLGDNFETFDKKYKDLKIEEFNKELNDDNYFNKYPREYFYCGYLLLKDHNFELKEDLKIILLKKFDLIYKLNIQTKKNDDTIHLDLNYIKELQDIYNEFISLKDITYMVDLLPDILKKIIISGFDLTYDELNKLIYNNNLDFMIESSKDILHLFFIILIKEYFDTYEENSIIYKTDDFYIFIDSIKLLIKEIYNIFIKYIDIPQVKSFILTYSENFFLFILIQSLKRINYDSIDEITIDMNSRFNNKLLFILNLNHTWFYDEKDIKIFIYKFLKLANLFYTDDGPTSAFCGLPTSDSKNKTLVKKLLHISITDDTFSSKVEVGNLKVNKMKVSSLIIANIISQINHKQKITNIEECISFYEEKKSINKYLVNIYSNNEFVKTDTQYVEILENNNYNYDTYFLDIMLTLDQNALIESFEYNYQYINKDLLKIYLYIVIYLEQNRLLTDLTKDNLKNKLKKLELENSDLYLYLNNNYIFYFNQNKELNELLLLRNIFLEDVKYIFNTLITKFEDYLDIDIPNYTLIIDQDFYNETLLCFHCYFDDTYDLYYSINKQTKLIPIKYNKDENDNYISISREINNKEYIYINKKNLLDYIRDYDDFSPVLINKLNKCLKNLNYSVWLYKTTDYISLLFEILDNDNEIYFEILEDVHTNTNNITLIFNKITYNVVQNPDLLSSFWLFFMDNGLVVSKETDLFIFLIMDQSFVNDSFISDVWIKPSKFSLPIECKLYNNYFHIIKFNSSHLNFNFSNSDNFLALFISLIFSQNVVALSLLKSRFFSEIENENLIIYKKQFKYIIDSPENIDIPYWAMLYNNNSKYMQREQYFIYNDLNITENDFNLQVLNNLTYIKIIKNISDKITIYKKTYDGEDLQTKLSKFLKMFRYKCSTRFKSKLINGDKTELNDFFLNNIYTLPKNLKRMFKNNKKILCNLFFSDNNKIEILSNIYIKYYKYFYFLLTLNIFNNITKQLNSVETRKIDCGIILHTIELLDTNLIYDFNKNRSLADILFELESDIFIRNEQKNKIIELLKTKSEQKNNAYEILMGKGKTSTLTPILLIEHLIESKNRMINKFDYNTAFSIVLPSHLIESSYNIMLKYNGIFNDIIINKVNNKNNYLLDNNKMNIISDTKFKEFILKIKLNDNPEIKLLENTFFIYDEIDSLINPLKSDLNMPSGEKINHSNFQIILDILFFIAKKDFSYYNFTVNNKYLIINYKSITTSTKSQHFAKLKVPPKQFNLINVDFCKIFKQKLDNLKKITVSLEYNKKYGFSKINNGIYNKLNYIAIPYIANNYPAEGSEFSDFELSIYLTIKSYYFRFLIIDDLFHIFYFLNKFDLDILKLTYTDIIDLITSLLGESRMNELIEISNESYVKFINTIKTDEIKKLYDKQVIIDFYLQNIIFKNYFSLYTYQTNISFVDLLDSNLIPHKISFSGTVNFNLPSIILNELKPHDSDSLTYYDNAIITQLNNIITDDIYQGEIESSIKSSTQDIKSKLFYYNSLDKENKLLDFINHNLIINGKLVYNALIDIGGIIVLKKSIEIIKIIYDLIISNHIDIKLLYVNENNQKMIYNEPISENYNNQEFQNVFIYYDHKNCVGMDFKQPYYMHGLVTINIKNTLTEVSQGIYRLRKINMGHTLDYYLPEDFIEDTNELYTRLTDNEQQLNISAKSRSKIQCLKYLKRNMTEYDSESYYEYLFYDTIKYSNHYLTEEEFIKKNIFNYIVYNDFKINSSCHENTQIVQEQEEEQEQELEEELEEEIVTTSPYYLQFVNDINVITQNGIKYFEDYININFNNFLICDYNMIKINMDDLLTINNFRIIFSLSVNYNILFNFHFIFDTHNYLLDNLFFLFNSKKNKVLIITSCEYYFINNHIENNSKKDKYNKEIMICDQYGKIVFPNNIKTSDKSLFKKIKIVSPYLFKSKTTIQDRIIIFQYIYNNKSNHINILFCMYLLNCISNKLDYATTVDLNQINNLEYIVEHFNICKEYDIDNTKFKIFIDQIIKILTDQTCLETIDLGKGRPLSEFCKKPSDLYSDDSLYKKYIKYKNKYLTLKYNQ
jgi:hypothetical protein